jgi:O-acetyl-ADP-ribose deacetylase (regulator of RNase III)
VTLIDLHGSLADAARSLGWASAGTGTIEALEYKDVREVPRSPGTAFVSPANSLGFMDGGIDFALSRIMFPGVETAVKAAIAAGGRSTLLGRPFLPIGRAVVVPTQVDGVRLVAAPTMWLPQDVRGTHNAYHATYAALAAATDAGVERLVIPGMGTGCGMLAAEEAVRQMMRAHLDFAAGLPPAYDAAEIEREQPCWYENTEFKVVPPGQVRTHT